MIKIAAVVCLAALASAEADADAYYNTYGYNNYGYSGLGYTNAYAAGYGINAYAAPLRYSGAYGYAAPAASAAITVRGYGTPAVVGSNVPYGYAASGRYVADSVGAVHIAKREAEAEPEADADAQYLNTYGYNNYGYSGLGYNTVAKPVVSSYVNRPIVAARPVVGAVSSYASRPVISTGYGINSYSAIAAPVGHAAYSAGGYYYGKREAEAEPEADADALYSTYGYNNYGYSAGLGYSAVARPVVSSYSAVRPAVYSTGYGINSAIARPVVSSYAARPVVSSYGARPILSTGYYSGYPLY